MPRRTEEKYSKLRKPIIALICEGKNKTETKYFNHFNDRDNLYNLKTFPSEATDPTSMAKKAQSIIDNLQLDTKLGDRVFCLIDLDLMKKQLDKVNIEKMKRPKRCKIEFILSNPCFEIWLLYYFCKYPKAEMSSQRVKEQLKKYVPQYTESFDIIKEYNLQDKHIVALNNSELRNRMYDKNQSVLDKNPYTEVSDLLNILLTYNKNEDN